MDCLSVLLFFCFLLFAFNIVIQPFQFVKYTIPDIIPCYSEMIFWINILRVLLWRRKHTEHWMNKTWLFWSQLLCSFSCKWTYDSWYVQVCFVYTSHLFHWIIQQNFIQFHLKSKNQFIVTWLEYEEINFPVKPLRCIIIFRLVLISSTLYRSLSPCPPPFPSEKVRTVDY